MAQKNCSVKENHAAWSHPDLYACLIVLHNAPRTFVVLGGRMPDRSWFLAANGQQQGPYPEGQLRDFIARGAVTDQTLVWTEGMAGWQKAGDVPGLLSSGGPPRLAQSGGPLVGRDGYRGKALSIDVPPLPFFGWSLIYVIGLLLVVPAPWAATAFYRWIVQRLSVPARSNLTFTGQPLDIWYIFVLLGLCAYAGSIGRSSVQILVIPVEAFLGWMALSWAARNLAANGQKLPIAFEGSALGYVGWFVLMYVSFISIIGWAWVITAWMRWMCRNVTGTHREIVFNGTGLEVLWRTVLLSFGCLLIIPIPWLMSWYTRWYVSQFELVERG